LIFEPNLHQEAVERNGVLAYQIYMPMEEITHAHRVDEATLLPRMRPGTKCLCVSRIRASDSAARTRLFYFVLQKEAVETMSEKIQHYIELVPPELRRYDSHHEHDSASMEIVAPRLRNESVILKDRHILEVRAVEKRARSSFYLPPPPLSDMLVSSGTFLSTRLGSALQHLGERHLDEHDVQSHS
jgi:hypothetical protein